MTRIAQEKEFHDRQARRRREALRPDDLAFTDDDYLDHESWIRPAFSQLGDVRGRRVLDLGCGHGMAAIVLARRGAQVTGFELSEGYLAEARLRARVNGAEVCWVQGDAHRLPFADGSFDLLWGNAVLHHLRLDDAAREVRRVVRPGGKAIFCEPWGGNPLVRWARRSLRYPGKEHTPDEEALRSRDLAPFRARFPKMRLEGHQLFSMVRRRFGTGVWIRRLQGVDAVAMACMPPLRYFCRYMVIRLPC
jgi:SAM-dependent methyltransferase